MTAEIVPFGERAPATRIYGRLALDRTAGWWRMSGVEPHVALRLKNNFPKLPKTETKVFSFRHSPESCADLDWFLQRYPMGMSDADRKALKGGRREFQWERDDLELIFSADWTPPPLIGFKDGKEPYPMQMQAIEVARRRGRLLVGDDVGLGKTIIALGTILDRRYLPAAVVVQSHLAFQWANKVKEFTSLRAHVIAGTTPYDLPQADVFVFRYSNIAGWVDVAAAGRFPAVVFDEIQELRTGTRTAKGRAGEVFAEAASELRLGLSATPIYNYGEEIFPVVQLIEPGALGDRDEFIREWCTPHGMGKWLVKDPDALGTYLREQNVMLRRVRSGRPVNTVLHEVDYDEEVAADAEAFARTLAIKVTTGSFAERGQAARELDILARQVTGVAKAKHVAAFVRVLLKAGKPVLLAGWHREVYEIWLEDLKEFRPVMYTGSETTAQKELSKKKFVEGETDLMIISLRSGTGLDGLQHRCSTVVFGELDWSPKVHEQVIGRLDRPGQTEEVTAVYLHADDGSDPLLINMLGLKASQARGITDPLAGVEHVYSDESRIKMLAELYLSREQTA
jgi:SNF2 family DNA or RNA helicase